jgi:hypothetical protein
MCKQGILSGHSLLRHNGLSTRCQTPAAWSKSPVQYSSVFDLWQVDDAIRFDLDIAWVEGCKQYVCSFLREWLDRQAVK